MAIEEEKLLKYIMDELHPYFRANLVGKFFIVEIKALIRKAITENIDDCFQKEL